jgi:hypothetical protein
MTVSMRPTVLQILLDPGVPVAVHCWSTLLDLNERVTLGRTPSQADLLRSTVSFVEGRVGPDSIYGVLHRACFSLFPDEMFADLFTDVGRRSMPPMIVAVVMVLQRLEGLSDREAVDRFAFDARWKYAAGGLDFDYPGFVHTVLVDMRARLARSDRPDRTFETVLAVARAAGLVGRKTVFGLDPESMTQWPPPGAVGGVAIMTKVQPPPVLGGRFAKDRFDIDLAAGTVTCPGQVSVVMRPAKGRRRGRCVRSRLCRLLVSRPMHHLTGPGAP